MADEPQTNQPIVLRAINWREVFPFTNIFRAFRIAVHPSKLVLGLLGLLVLYAGGRIMDAVWSQKHQANYGEAFAYEGYKGTNFASRIESDRGDLEVRFARIVGTLDARDKAL